MMSTFTFAPDWGATEKTKPRVLSASFGNGYEQRVADGLNWVPRVWDLSFSLRSDTEAGNILAFFQACGGVSSFDWTPPLGAAGLWVCREWSVSMETYGGSTIRASFEEVFE